MTIPVITRVQLGGGPLLPLLLLGPSLGTSATTLWSAVASRLGDGFHVVGWDLPGHGTNSGTSEPFTMAELADGVFAMATRVLAEREEPRGSFAYAGDSVGGAVGQQLLLDRPDRVTGAVLLGTAAWFGDPATWQARAAQVRDAGTVSMVETSIHRWFPAGFLERRPEVSIPLLQALKDADREGYAATCEALGAFDVRRRLSEIAAPVLVVTGAEDVAAPVEAGRLLAERVQHGRLVVLDGVAHLPPAEAPDVVTALLRDHLGSASRSPRTTVAEVIKAGRAVRRAVFGDR